MGFCWGNSHVGGCDAAALACRKFGRRLGRRLDEDDVALELFALRFRGSHDGGCWLATSSRFGRINQAEDGAVSCLFDVFEMSCGHEVEIRACFTAPISIDKENRRPEGRGRRAVPAIEFRISRRKSPSIGKVGQPQQRDCWGASPQFTRSGFTEVGDPCAAMEKAVEDQVS